MYLIHFKKKINPVEVDRTTGEAIKNMRETKLQKDTLIDLNGLQVELGDIGIIEPVAERSSKMQVSYEPLTPEQREEIQPIIKRVGAELRQKGIIGKGKERIEKPDVVWHEFCQNPECGKKLPANLARVCSGECYQKVPLRA